MLNQETRGKSQPTNRFPRIPLNSVIFLQIALSAAALEAINEPLGPLANNFLNIWMYEGAGVNKTLVGSLVRKCDGGKWKIQVVFSFKSTVDICWDESHPTVYVGAVECHI